MRITNLDTLNAGFSAFPESPPYSYTLEEPSVNSIVFSEPKVNIPEPGGYSVSPVAIGATSNSNTWNFFFLPSVPIQCFLSPSVLITT